MLIIDDEIWIAGGLLNSETSYSKSVECIDLKTNTVTIAPPMLSSRSDFSLIFDGRYIYAVGGDKNGFAPPIGTIERFDRNSKLLS